MQKSFFRYMDTTGMQAQEYGNLGAALTNGITIQSTENGSVDIDITDGQPIKTNAEWGSLCYDVDLKTWGAGNELLVVRFTFGKSGKPITLHGNASDQLEVLLNDDLSGLITHKFMVQGLKVESF